MNDKTYIKGKDTALEETSWATLRIGELKTMLCLALNNDEAIDWVNWSIPCQTK